MKKDSVKAVQEVLGNPAFVENTEYAGKIRTRLMSLSIISFFCILLEVKISSSSSFLGLKFDNLQEQHFIYVMAIVIFYFLIQYLVAVSESFTLWRLRLTGTKTAFKTAAQIASPDGDYPDNPKQSTLYNWWLSQTRGLNKLHDDIDRLNECSIYIKKNKDKFIGLEKIDDRLFQQNVERLIETVKDMQFNFGERDRLYKSDRILASLERYNNTFYYFLNIQNMRWLIFDFIAPFSLGLTSLIMLGVQAWALTKG